MGSTVSGRALWEPMGPFIPQMKHAFICFPHWGP